MKFIFVADIHIKLGQKGVNSDWQKARVMKLAEKIVKLYHEKGCDSVIIGGDLLDVANPSIEEVGLMYSFLKALPMPTYLIPGNHEMVNAKLDCFVYVKEMLQDLGVFLINEFKTIDGVDFIPYNIIKSKLPSKGADIAVTHVRGEIPPHVKPEIDLEVFKQYSLVFCGDLHSYKNSQLNLLYPGSPYTTSFHRGVPTGANGVFIVDSSTKTYEWVELDMPQLIKVSIQASDVDTYVRSTYHNEILEVSGTLEELAKLEIDKVDTRKAKEVSKPAVVQFKESMTVEDELVEYLYSVKQLKTDDVSGILTALAEVKKELNND